jgi:hypothetical protein
MSMSGSPCVLHCSACAKGREDVAGRRDGARKVNKGYLRHWMRSGRDFSSLIRLILNAKGARELELEFPGFGGHAVTRALHGIRTLRD